MQQTTSNDDDDCIGSTNGKLSRVLQIQVYWFVAKRLKYKMHRHAHSLFTVKCNKISNAL